MKLKITLRQLTGERVAAASALIFVVILGLTLPAGSALAQGAMSLTITPGARADGMGRAFVALPTDATANFWNPAALGYEKGKVFGLMHAQLVPGLADDVYYENLGYAMNLPNWGGIGASLVYLSYGKSMATDQGGTPLGEFTSYEISPQIHVGTEVMKGLAAGLTLKYVYVNLAPAWATQGEPGTGYTFAADVGLLMRVRDMAPSFPVPLNIGVNVQNLGPNITFTQQGGSSDPIGRNLKIGFGAQVLNLPKFTGTVAYDYNKALWMSEDGTGRKSMSTIQVHNAGAELGYADFVFLRGGYIYDKDGEIKDPTFGVGFIINLGVDNLGFDYASVPQARGLDRVSKFSINFRF
jgi:hypothetical protein